MRPHIAFASVLMVACSLGSCSGLADLPVTPILGGGTIDDAQVEVFVDRVNAHRRSLGLNALTWDPAAADVALEHSRDMVLRDYFSHTNPDGETSADRLEAAGIQFSVAGENIAFGYTSGEAVFEAWLDSPDHRENIEYPAFTHHGVGRFRTYWTHVFFTPRRN